MKNKIKVAVIVPTSNRPQDICCLLDNLLFKQDRPSWLDLKIYVIDNGNSMDHIAINTRFKHYISSSRVIVRYIPESLGATPAFVMGMDIASRDENDILILVDNDAYPLSRDLIKSLVEAIISKKADAAMPVNVLSTDQIDEANYNNPYVAAFHFFTLSKGIYSQIGPPDTSFYMYCDDVEYRARIQKNGFRFLVLSNKFYIHNSNSSRLDLGLPITYGLRNWMLIQKKYGFSVLSRYYSLFYNTLSYSIYSIYQGPECLYMLVQGIRSLRTRGKIETYLKMHRRKAALVEIPNLPKNYAFLSRSDFMNDLLLSYGLNCTSVHSKNLLRDLFSSVGFTLQNKRSAIVSTSFGFILLVLLFSRATFGVMPMYKAGKVYGRIIFLTTKKKILSLFNLFSSLIASVILIILSGTRLL